LVWFQRTGSFILDISNWGNIDNLKGTVDPDNPFLGQSPRTDELLDEVVDGAWYQRNYAECKDIAGDEDFMVLGVILYCDKTSTDVYQRAGLEPMSFPFTIFSRECRYRLGLYLVNYQTKERKWLTTPYAQMILSHAIYSSYMYGIY